ncbi:S24 family peptidase [Klebsiella pneumoniae]|uniref:S24 family peptidase n=1 Tax=Klebsiella pneumoniae TaxID=573 RepID=UPI0034CF96B3
MSSLPTIPILKEDKEKYVAFDVSGDSMDDGSSRAYHNGYIVICKVCPVYMVLIIGLHIVGKEYIIVHKERILLKRIIDLDMNNGKLILRSFNPTYRDLEVDLADVKQLLVVEYQQKRKS